MFGESILLQQAHVVLGLLLFAGAVAQVHHVGHRAGERLGHALRHLDAIAVLGHDRVVVHDEVLAIAAAAVAAEEARRQWEAEMAEKQRQFNEQMAEQRAYRNYLNQAQNNNQTVKSWNFGNGYQLVQNPNGEAEYYVNGNKTNAYDFLVGTGGNNTDWNKWNDVWNNGVSTRGINGNTIGGINNFLNTGIYNSSYDYLRGL